MSTRELRLVRNRIRIIPDKPELKVVCRLYK
jgi:hypothetical protein